MIVGRTISPECSTDERREWQKEAAALAISSRRPTAPLGRPAPGRFPPCPFIVLSRGDRKPRAAQFRIRFICTTIQYSSRARAVRFRYREGASALTGDELQGRRVDKSWLLFFFVGLFRAPSAPLERVPASTS